MIFLIVFLCISGDEAEIGPVSSEPLERGATSVVLSAPLSEPAAAPTLVEVQGVAMEVPIPSASQQWEEVIAEQYIHILIYFAVHLSTTNYCPFFQSIFLSQSFIVSMCRNPSRKSLGRVGTRRNDVQCS